MKVLSLLHLEKTFPIATLERAETFKPTHFQGPVVFSGASTSSSDAVLLKLYFT